MYLCPFCAARKNWLNVDLFSAAPSYLKKIMIKSIIFESIDRMPISIFDDLLYCLICFCSWFCVYERVTLKSFHCLPKIMHEKLRKIPKNLMIFSISFKFFVHLKNTFTWNTLKLLLHFYGWIYFHTNAHISHWLRRWDRGWDLMTQKIEVRKRGASHSSCKELPFLENSHGADQEI